MEMFVFSCNCDMKFRRSIKYISVCLDYVCFAPINCTNSRHGTFYFVSYFISSNNDLKNLYIFLGKGGFGNTKFIAFEKLAWHYECFICGLCNESMVGKGFIQEEKVLFGKKRISTFKRKGFIQ